jgi:tRNA pseudouridine55 synthase
MGRKLRSSSANCTPNNVCAADDGLLNLDKPAGLTSHDVVARVRRWTRLSRVGHAGTLDPPATGVLLVGLGKGTKLVQFLQEYPKTYRATLQLGVRTDTRDATGRIVEVNIVGSVTAEDVAAVLAGFQGVIEQLPPMYSALKRQGQRLYALARQGIEVERQPRRVQISRLTLLAFSGATATVEVECSGGTYIRVLADDIGARLGCGAHLSALTRTAVGPFTRDRAVTLEAFDEAVRQGRWRTHVLPLAQAMVGFPAIVVTPGAAHALTQGIPPTAAQVWQLKGTFELGETVAIGAADGTLLAVGAANVRTAELTQVPATHPVVRLRRVVRDQR